MKRLLKLFFYTILPFYIGACYKPSSDIASGFLGENVYVKTIVDKQDPVNSVYITDLFRNYIMSKLHKKLTTQDNADTKIIVEVTNIDFKPLYYNQDGYALEYSVILGIKFSVYKFEAFDEIQTSSNYTFYLPPNSVIGDNLKNEAIKKASKDNFDEFVSLIVLKGFENDGK